MILSEIQTKLAATPAISAIVSSRVYVGQAPQTVTYPFIALNTISSDHNNNDSKVRRDRIQFTCWETTTIKGDTLVTAVRNVFFRFTGLLTSINVGNVQIDSINYFYDSTTGKHVYTLDAFFQYKEN